MKRWLLLLCAVLILSLGISVQGVLALSADRYVVQPGDTLYGIARRHGVTVDALATTNGLSRNAWVYVGQSLTIPGSSVPAQPVQSGSTYVVQPGDNLFRIGLRYGTTAAALRAANGLRSDLIYVGQRLLIPGNGTAPAAQPSAPPATNPAPGHGAGGGKWIDINLSAQTLTAYEGHTAVLHAVVSTGKAGTPTVVGTYHIYAKYTATRMRGPGYDLPNVPYAMFFYRGYSIHGTYWHNNFGVPMSHGCVNMRTPDAQWLFNWAPMGTKVVAHY